MICKNCGKELEDDEIVCTQCGQDNSPETVEEEKSRINPWKIAFPTVVSLSLLLVLSWLLHFGVTGNLLPKKNDIYYKASYTSTEEELIANRNKVVATLGKNKLTNSQLQIFYRRQIQDFIDEFDNEKPLDSQIYDEATGLTWQQYLLQMALNTWKQYQLLMDHAKGEGFVIPAEYQEYLDGLVESLGETAKENGYDNADEMISEDFALGSTAEDYKYYMERYYWATLYYYDLTNKVEVTDEDLEAAYEKSKEVLANAGITKDSGLLVNMRNILMVPETSNDVPTEEEWEVCRLEANELLLQWVNGGKTEESFAQLAVSNSKDTNSSSNGGLYTYIRKDSLLTVDVRHILIKPEGGTTDANGTTTTYTDAEWEACRKKAQDIYDAYLAGEKTEEVFGELAKKHSQDGNAAQGGIYEGVYKNDMVETFDAWIFDETRESGDTGLVKTQYGYHIMYFVNRNDSLNNWLFAEERKAGDYEVIRTPAGYQIIYYSSAEEGWILYCRMSVVDEKATQKLVEITESAELSTTYRRVFLDV